VTPFIIIPPTGWAKLAQEYHLHHFACPTCIAASKGEGYGARCTAGASLWTAYQEAR